MVTDKDIQTWHILSQQSDNESPKKRALRGAICDYIDEMQVSELMEDMLSILIKEEVYFRNRADIYADLKGFVEQMTEEFKRR
jgi:hypothetical protein